VRNLVFLNNLLPPMGFIPHVKNRMFRFSLTLATLKSPNVQLHVGAGDGFFGGELAGRRRSPMRSRACNRSL